MYYSNNTFPYQSFDPQSHVGILWKVTDSADVNALFYDNMKM